jgi:SET domain
MAGGEGWIQPSISTWTYGNLTARAHSIRSRFSTFEEAVVAAKKYVFKFDEKLFLDASEKGSPARWVNHSPVQTALLNDINQEEEHCYVVCAGGNEIEEGTELTFEYERPKQTQIHSL